MSLWNTVTGVRHVSLYRHTGDILAIAFARDDKHLAVALEDWTVLHHPLAIDDLVALGRKRVKRSLTAEAVQDVPGRRTMSCRVDQALMMFKVVATSESLRPAAAVKGNKRRREREKPTLGHFSAGGAPAFGRRR